MKFRCTSNSIRLRVRKSELEQLQSKGELIESIHFGKMGGLFQIKLLIDADYKELDSHFEAGLITVIIPQHLAQKWINSDLVGMQRIKEIEGDETLEILIEKDFPCLDRAEENRDDTFWELAPDKGESC